MPGGSTPSRTQTAPGDPWKRPRRPQRPPSRLRALVILLRRPSSVWLILFGYSINLAVLYGLALGERYLW